MMKVSRKKTSNEKGELSSLSSQSTRKRTKHKVTPTATRRSRRLQLKMEKEPQVNQNDEKEDSQSEENQNRSEEETTQELISRLQERNTTLYLILRDLRQEHGLVTGRYGTWGHHGIAKWPQFMSGIVYNMSNWAFSYAHRHTKDLDCLSKEQKRQIISSLEGYCVQEDFDTLVSRIPYPMRDKIPAIFAKMFLVKDILTRFFDNPFWYFSTNPGSHDDSEESEQKDALFRTELKCLYKKFFQVSPSYARSWRQAATRLSNSTTLLDARDLTFGEQVQSHRDALAKSAVRKVLSDKTFQYLIRPPEDSMDTVEREDELYDSYQSAAYLSAHMCTEHASIEVQKFSDVVPWFDRRFKTMEAEYLHFLEEGSKRLDGHPVLAITQPAIFECGSLIKWNHRVLIMKAEVIVEDKCDSENIGQAEESKKEVAPKED